MSTLYLVRHGQASPFGADYDILSDQGKEQARQLGCCLAENRIHLDVIYRGPRRRHRETAESLVASGRQCETDLPDPVVIDEFDEYPFEEMVKKRLDRILQAHPELTDFVQPEADEPRAARLKKLSTFIQTVTLMWVRSELDLGDDLETYPQFQARIDRGLDRIMKEQGAGKQVLLVSSVGPITLSVGRALGLKGERCWDLGWVLRNASISELRYRSDGTIGLIDFNGVGHLRDPQLVTLL